MYDSLSWGFFLCESPRNSIQFSTSVLYVKYSGWICCKISTISKNQDVLIFFEKYVYYLFSKTSKTLFSEFIRQDSFQTQFLMIWHYFYFYLTVGRIFGKNLSLSGIKFYLNHLFVLMLNRYSSNLSTGAFYPFRQYRIKGHLNLTGNFTCIYFLETFFYSWCIQKWRQRICKKIYEFSIRKNPRNVVPWNLLVTPIACSCPFLWCIVLFLQPVSGVLKPLAFSMHAWVLQHFSCHREDHKQTTVCRSSQINTTKNSFKSSKNSCSGCQQRRNPRGCTCIGSRNKYIKIRVVFSYIVVSLLLASEVCVSINAENAKQCYFMKEKLWNTYSKQCLFIMFRVKCSPYFEFGHREV